ncbi:recombinase family protein [Paenibacillus sp. EPM92]|uniref:recombinase family protein n=1 Tax=Paenibacillus sp. EPM92 TaxID=1561195 RepID=UPI001914E45D|nr:recombinase family protein [Paenibacillus sp. EPM92]
MQEKIKCGIYARVSTDKQGDSIENQVSQGLEYIKRLGEQYDTDNVIIYSDEAVSGYYTSVFDRAEMKRAIADAKNNLIKLLVFKEVSRVGRDKQENPAIIGMFEQYGVRVIAINDNYDSLNRDNITFDILSVLSEQESKKISVRVSSARKQKAARGQWNGEPPFGYRVNPETKRLVIDEDTGKIPPLVFDWYVNRGIGTFKIAEQLNKKGILTKNGNRWSRETINRMIRNQAYIGQVVYGTRRNMLQREYDDSGKMSKKKVQLKIDKKEWQVIEDCHPCLIDKETFYAAQKIMLSRTHDRAPKRAYHPLTGILVCGKCGQGMVCQKRSYNGKEYRYYICKTYHKYGRDTCSQANINADELERDIIQAVQKRLAALPDDILQISSDRENDILRLEQELKSINNRKDRLVKDQRDIFAQRELFPEEQYRKQMLDIKAGIEWLEEESTIIQNQIVGIIEKITETSSFQHITEEFKSLDPNDTERVRVLLHDIIGNITIDEENIRIEYNYAF